MESVTCSNRWARVVLRLIDCLESLTPLSTQDKLGALHPSFSFCVALPHLHGYFALHLSSKVESVSVPFFGLGDG